MFVKSWGHLVYFQESGADSTNKSTAWHCRLLCRRKNYHVLECRNASNGLDLILYPASGNFITGITMIYSVTHLTGLSHIWLPSVRRTLWPSPVCTTKTFYQQGLAYTIYRLGQGTFKNCVENLEDQHPRRLHKHNQCNLSPAHGLVVRIHLAFTQEARVQFPVWEPCCPICNRVF